MRITIECDVPAFVPSGMGVSTRGLLSELFLDRSFEFHCVFSSDAPQTEWMSSLGQCPNVQIHRSRYSKRIQSLRQLAGRSHSLSLTTGVRADVSLLLNPILPDISDSPHLCVVWDLSSVRLEAPSSVPWHGRTLARRALRGCARRSVRLLAISQYTRSDLADWTGISAAGIGLLPLGIDPAWRRSVAEEEVVRVQRVHRIHRPYFCWSGEITKRKNVDGLLPAYADAFQRHGEEFPDLVLVGKTGRDSEDIDDLPSRLGIEHKVHRLPRLGIDQLIPVVSGARAFIFPSWYEGFGLPVVEALARGVPVAVSNRTSLPEVGGPTALVFDPASRTGMRDSLTQLAFDEELQERTQAEGPAWASKFSYSAAAAVLRGEILAAAHVRTEPDCLDFRQAGVGDR